MTQIAFTAQNVRPAGWGTCSRTSLRVTLCTSARTLAGSWLALPLLLAAAASAQNETEAPDTAAPATTTVAEAVAASASKGILPIPNYTGDIWSRQYLTGDWWGARTNLANVGIQFDVDWYQTVQGVATGGTQTGTRYGGSLDYLVNVDFYRMGLIPGGLLKVRAQTRYGQSVNQFTGSIAPVNSDAFFPLSADDIPITVSDLTYYQFLSDNFGLFLGKIDTLDGDNNPFASGRGNTQFMNSNFLFSPVAIMTVPYSTLGGGLLWNITPDISWASVIMNTTDASTTTGFGDIGDGWTWSNQVGVQYRLGELPGGQMLIVTYAGDNSYKDLSARYQFQPGQGFARPTKDDSWSVNWSGWQYLYTAEPHAGPVTLNNGSPGIQGFGLFARAGFGDKTTNPIGWFASLGAGGQGIIPGRKDDQFGVAYAYTDLQVGRVLGALGLQDNSQAVEAFYNIAITPSVSVTLDLQVINPFLRNVDPALVLGMRLGINF